MQPRSFNMMNTCQHPLNFSTIPMIVIGTSEEATYLHTAKSQHSRFILNLYAYILSEGIDGFL